MRILHIKHPHDIKHVMQDIQVDPYGVKIMLPKAITHLIRLNSVSNILANILKQEMLSLGGDVALARGALTGAVKSTDCLLMGNLAQFNRLHEKLKFQPFGLNKVGRELAETLRNYEKDKFTVRAGRHTMNLGNHTSLMGIVNMTPDSFSADGLLWVSGHQDVKVSWIVEFVQRLVKDGADIIDVGGESSRPGAKPVSLKEELSRVIPVIKSLAKKIKVPISVDTYKPEVARQALDNGASIVNDITGLRNPAMTRIVARYNAAAIIMHMKGTPRTMQRNPHYTSLVDEILRYLEGAIATAETAGINKDKIIVDPGIGFGKTTEDNLAIIDHLSEFRVLGRPILVGPSRKSFIGKILSVPPEERLPGTVSACVLAAQNGAHILRVHDVKEVKQALKLIEAMERR